MKYVCDVCGWEYDEEKDIQKEESLSRNKMGRCSRRF